MKTDGLNLPLPLSVVDNHGASSYYIIKGPMGRQVANVFSPNEAAAIVSACNSHDELVAALQDLYCATQHGVIARHPAFAQARAALAKAKGEA